MGYVYVPSVPLCSPRNTSLFVILAFKFLVLIPEAAAYLNFFRGLEYDPTVDWDAMMKE